jgi:hypothetical protein
MPPPLDVSIASIMDTTSAISGRLSGFASQQRFITFAKALGQHRGISGLRFCTSKIFFFMFSVVQRNKCQQHEQETGHEHIFLPVGQQQKLLLRS